MDKLTDEELNDALDGFGRVDWHKPEIIVKALRELEARRAADSFVLTIKTKVDDSELRALAAKFQAPDKSLFFEKRLPVPEWEPTAPDWTSELS